MNIIRRIRDWRRAERVKREDERPFQKLLCDRSPQTCISTAPIGSMLGGGKVWYILAEESEPDDPSAGFLRWAWTGFDIVVPPGFKVVAGPIDDREAFELWARPPEGAI